MICIQNLNFTSSQNNILSEISLDIKPHGLTTIVGKNGSGKSTLIKCLGQLIEDYSGNISLKGRDLKDLSFKERARLISYVPQFLNLDSAQSVEEFIHLSRFPHMNTYRGLTKEEVLRRDQILNELGIQKLLKRSLSSLSGGEGQKVYIASAIFQGADIMLLDEPTAFLDPRCQDEVNQIIVNLSKSMSVVCVSHDINSTILNSDRVIGLNNGKVVFDGTTNKLMLQSELENIFDKRFKTIRPDNYKIDIILPEVFCNE